MAHLKYTIEPVPALELYARYESVGYVSDWEHLGTAESWTERDYLLSEYSLAFGEGWSFEWRVA